MRLGLLAASLVLVAGAAAGCGDGDGSGGGGGDAAPSTKEFCGALKTFQDDFAQADPTKDLAGYIKTLKEAADRLEDVGTPDDMSDAAEDGFELTIGKIKDLSDSASVDDLADLGDVSEEDQKKLDALDEYISKTCPELSGETDG
jgi:hypothetical protein